MPLDRSADDSKGRQARWLYVRGPHAGLLEYGIWIGGRPPVFRPHFHAEGQLTAVLAGWRRFRVGDQIVTVSAGQCLYIPAGMVHQGIAADGAAIRCINAYAAASWGGRPAVIDIGTAEDPAALFALAEARLGRPAAASMRIDLPDGPVADAAIRAGVSREHFSRRFRRLTGIAPRGFRLARRLTEARARLKGGEPIAAIAADLGFADQSHLGRLFRQAFGVTPRAYRLMMR
jgi:AraC-like DNA-binding protein